jgi:hypothetical protein
LYESDSAEILNEKSNNPAGHNVSVSQDVKTDKNTDKMDSFAVLVCTALKLHLH